MVLQLASTIIVDEIGMRILNWHARKGLPIHISCMVEMVTPILSG